MIAERVLEAILDCREVDVSDVQTALDRVRSDERPPTSADRIDLLEQIARQAKVTSDAYQQFLADADSDDPTVDPGLSYDSHVAAMEFLRELLTKLP